MVGSDADVVFSPFAVPEGPGRRVHVGRDLPFGGWFRPGGLVTVLAKVDGLLHPTGGGEVSVEEDCPFLFILLQVEGGLRRFVPLHLPLDLASVALYLVTTVARLLATRAKDGTDVCVVVHKQNNYDASDCQSNDDVELSP